MQGPARKVVQAILYEVIAIVLLSPILAMVFDKPLSHAGALSAMMSFTAMVWNMLFNWMFERWEARQRNRERTVWRRLLHSLGFEGGLLVLLLPLVSGWLNISLLAALTANVAMFVFFFFYALVFQWAFDRVFDLPESARPSRAS